MELVHQHRSWPVDKWLNHQSAMEYESEQTKIFSLVYSLIPFFHRLDVLSVKFVFAPGEQEERNCKDDEISKHQVDQLSELDYDLVRHQAIFRWIVFLYNRVIALMLTVAAHLVVVNHLSMTIKCFIFCKLQHVCWVVCTTRNKPRFKI